MIRLKLVLAALAALIAGVPHGRGVQPAVPSASLAVATSDGAIAVNGSRPLLPPEIVRVSGDVIGLAAGMVPAVVVKVNGVPVSSQVTGSSYVADIMAPHNAAVSVEAYAPRVFYRAVAGTAGELARYAGSDGMVTVAEHQGVRVSPWSTATVLLTERVLGRAIQADEDLSRVRPVLATADAWQSFASSVTEHDLGAMAEAMVRYADGRLALPQGKATGYDVVSDPLAFGVIRSQVDPASRDFVERSGHRQPVASLESLPEQIVLSSRASTLPLAANTRHTLLLTRLGGDRMRVDMSRYSDALLTDGSVMPGTAMPEFQASLTAEGDVRLVPQSRLAWTVMADGGRTEVELEAMRLQRMAEGSYSLWSLAFDTKSMQVARPDLGAVARRQWSVLWGADLSSLARPITWAAGQRIALPSHCLETVTAPSSGRSLNACEAVEYRLDTGGQGWTEDTGPRVDATMRPQSGSAFGATFQWSKLEGGRRVRFQGAATTTDAWVIGDGDSATDFVLLRTTGTSSDVAGQSIATISTAVTGEFIPLPTAAGSGKWRLAQSSLDYAYPKPFKPSYFVRLGDGRSNEYLTVDGIDGEATPSGWESAAGRIYDTRYRARFANPAQLRNVFSCTQAFAEGATECAPVRIRYFKALARSGNRIYGYTDFYHNSKLQPPGYSGTYTVVRSGGGPTYYDCEDGGCLAPPAAAGSLETAATDPHGARSHRFADAHAHLRLPLRRLRP